MSTALVLMFLFAAHASYLDGGFVWLDHGDIEQGRALLPLRSATQALFFRFGDTAFYRPLVSWVHSLDHALYGARAAGYHLTNVLLHLGAATVVPTFLALFFALDGRQRLLALLVFGIHPIGFLPVGAIAYRSELLLVLSVCLALGAHARARAMPAGIGARLLAPLALGLALLAKETALVVSPALIILWELLPATAKRGRRPRLQQWPLFAAEAAVLAGYLLLRHQAVPELWRASAAALPAEAALSTRLDVLGGLLSQLALPTLPSLSDATAVVGWTAPGALAAAALGVAGGVTLWRRGLRTTTGRWLALLGITLAPALNVVPLPRFRSPHYGYLALLAVAAGAALLAGRARGLGRSVRLALALLAVSWLAVATATTFDGGRRWRDDRSLFVPEVAADPRFAEGQAYLGDVCLARGELRCAAEHYLAARAQRPKVIAYLDRTAVTINLAAVRLKQGHLLRADALLGVAARHSHGPRRRQIAYNRALVASRRRDNKAIVALLAPWARSWRRPEPLLLLARALHRLGRQEQATRILRRALPLLEPAKRRRLAPLLRGGDGLSR